MFVDDQVIGRLDAACRDFHGPAECTGLVGGELHELGAGLVHIGRGHVVSSSLHDERTGSVLVGEGFDSGEVCCFAGHVCLLSEGDADCEHERLGVDGFAVDVDLVVQVAGG